MLPAAGYRGAGVLLSGLLSINAQSNQFWLEALAKLTSGQCLNAVSMCSRASRNSVVRSHRLFTPFLLASFNLNNGIGLNQLPSFVQRNPCNEPGYP
jgi:hypothetical protein